MKKERCCPTQKRDNSTSKFQSQMTFRLCTVVSEAWVSLNFYLTINFFKGGVFYG
jgi:hypothetical protein